MRICDNCEAKGAIRAVEVRLVNILRDGEEAGFETLLTAELCDTCFGVIRARVMETVAEFTRLFPRVGP